MKRNLYSPTPVKMTRIISVYIIFAFLLMPFTGCGKLKNSPISGLNQSETPAPPKVNSQPQAPASPKVNNQSETSASPKVNNQSETSAPSKVNNQSEASAPPEVNSQPKAKEVADKKWVYVSGLTILAVVIGASYIFAPPPPSRT